MAGQLGLDEFDILINRVQQQIKRSSATSNGADVQLRTVQNLIYLQMRAGPGSFLFVYRCTP